MVDDHIWICKTHYPLTLPDDLPQQVSKAICCVRNPLDVIMSEFNFMLTWTHNKVPADGDLHIKYQSIFEKVISDKILSWNAFHEYWKEKGKDIPVFFFRYEDMLMKPQKTLEEIFAFLLSLRSIEGKFIQKRIEEVIKLGHEASFSYKPHSIGLNKNIKKYSAKQLTYIKEAAAENLFYFGYVNMEGNPYGFFDFDNPPKEYKQQFKAFKDHNEKTIEFITSNEKKAKRQSIFLNDGKEENFRRKSGIPPFDVSVLELQTGVKIIR